MTLKVKFHSLTGRIDPELMLAAFKAVRRNRGAAGVDKVSIEMFEANLDQNLLALMRQLKEGSYQPLPARRVYIEKGGGKLRSLGIPAVRDRVAQEVLRRLLDPCFEPTFHDCSFGFRKGRNCHQAVEKLKELQRLGYRYVLDADVQGFFDHLCHSVLMQQLALAIADGNILNLAAKCLTAGVLEEGTVRPTKEGTPQGGVISPLFSNVVLNLLDHHLERLGFCFVRYADDFVVLTKTQARAEEALLCVEAFLRNELGLQLAPDKTRVTTFKKGFDFLGFRLGSGNAKMRDKAVVRFKDKVREITRRHRNLDAQVIVRLNRLVRGTANYFAAGFATVVDQFDRLDRWLRMRIRSMKFKRRSKADNRRLWNKHLLRMGLLSLKPLAASAR